jgi:hypothetical protein
METFFTSQEKLKERKSTFEVILSISYIKEASNLRTAKPSFPLLRPVLKKKTKLETFSLFSTVIIDP